MLEVSHLKPVNPGLDSGVSFVECLEEAVAASEPFILVVTKAWKPTVPDDVQDHRGDDNRIDSVVVHDMHGVGATSISVEILAAGERV